MRRAGAGLALLLALAPSLALAQAVSVLAPDAAIRAATAEARRARSVTVDVDALAAAARDGRPIVLDAGLGAGYTTTAERVDWRSLQRFTWFGAVAGGGRATITVEGSRMYARMVGPAGVLMVEPSGDGHVAFVPLPFEGEGDDTLPPPTSDSHSVGDGDELFPDELHLAIFYTSQVADSLGDALPVFLQATADQLSDVLANSNVDFRARLVLTGEVVHTETPQLSGNLSMLQDPTDGIMDEVHDLRDEASADFVALLVETGTNSATGCGVAYLMGSLDPGFESAAFSVTKRRCAPDLVFSHEVGHNMGLLHDIYVSPGPGMFAYSHGYVNIDSMNTPPGRPGIRTPLAYHSLCADMGGECVRIPYYSTIEQLYNGQVIGDAETADNVRTVRQSAVVAAGFRAPVELASWSGDTGAGPTWQRPECSDPSDLGTCVPSSTATAVPYATAGTFHVTRSGRHYLRSDAAFDGVILLYEDVFDPSTPLAGLVGYAEPDPSAPQIRRLLLSADLVSDQPYVVVTTGVTNGDAGAFTNNLFGPTEGGVVVIPGTAEGPAATSLSMSGPTPNPGSADVSLSVTTDRARHILVTLVDVLGRVVAVLHDGPLSGMSTLPLRFETTRFAPGDVRVDGGDAAVTRRLTIVR